MSDQPPGLLESVLDLTRALRASFDRRGGRHGLTFARARLLTTIARHPGVSQARLAALLEIETPTLKRLLDALEAQGLAERRPTPGDARKHAIHLTAAAQIPPLLGFRAEAERALAAGIPPDDLETTRRTLARMAQNAAGMDAARK
ncbi:MarR family transcriptional regulator [Paracoccus sp. (in: a-proteobacteria)]|uniref:MarR family winged helix-turn-helix transcriptional regulator n=1 Tax=Paracoccus sp. TaxID=267 RepID=UPI0032209999